eukprot:6974192-Prymnesium_polylepis.3
MAPSSWAASAGTVLRTMCRLTAPRHCISIRTATVMECSPAILPCGSSMRESRTPPQISIWMVMDAMLSSVAVQLR